MWILKTQDFGVSSLFFRNLKREYPQISHGKGVWVTDKNNKSYLDACSGAVVANIGHGVAEINDAISQQLSQIAFAHTSQFISEPALKLAQELIDMAPSRFNPGGRAYFVSGGSEAIETAIKMARGYFFEKGLYDKSVIVSRWNSYHGSTLGALAATGHPARRTPYLPLLAAHPHVTASFPYRCPCGARGNCQSEQCGIALANELEQVILQAGAEKVMAFVAEPVVGAALGAVAPHPGYFKRIREICDEHDVLLIADEVMTGLGRVGAPFGLSLFGVEADIIALGKGLSAGYMPLGAVLASAKVVAAFEMGSAVFEHGFTYSGHPLACAAGVAVLNYMKQHRLIDRVLSLESKLRADLGCLSETEIVGDLRGKGFLLALEFVSDKEQKTPFNHNLRVSQKVAVEAAKLGLLVYPGSGTADGFRGDHLIVAPPFTISEDELAELCARLLQAVENVSANLKSSSAF